MEQLKQIRQIIIPDLEKTVDPTYGVVYIDRSVPANLEAILTDIENKQNDQITVDTLKSIIYKINKVVDILGGDSRKITENGYYMVSPNKKE